MIHAPLKPNRNKLYFIVLVFIFVGILIFNLFNLQVVKGSKYYFDSKNSFSAFSVDKAARGIIYDRNGIKLVDNILKYNLYVYKDDTNSEGFKKTIDNLTQLFKEDINEKYKKEFEKVKEYKNISEVKLFTRLDYNPYIFQIEANPQNFPLVITQKTTVRKYLYPELTSHIIGYTSEITKEDYDTGKFNFGDDVGKFGLEKGYDDILRGKNGIDRVDFYSSDGKKVTSSIQQKQNGQDVYLSIDISYQRKIYELIQKATERADLKRTISSSVVLQDVKNGEILAMASYPNFDANKFALGIDQKDYNIYLNDPGKPLINKAIQYAQPPGSIFKTLTDMVALEEGVIDRSTRFDTGGVFKYGGVEFQDAGRVDRGTINVVDGLCVSSNIFHMKTAIKLDEATSGRAASLMGNIFNQIGLNKSSNLNIGYESPGYFPTPEDKKKKGQNWLQGYLLNASIGQGEVKLTALSAANLTSTIANKGVVVPQTIILDKQRKIENHQLPISKKNFDIINEGMRCAARKDNGYLGGIYDTKIYPEVSNKTGTAETGQLIKGQDVIHGWEITFTPSDKPELAMAVFMENGGAGYKGGFISREFYKTWHKEFRNTQGTTIKN